MAGVKNHPRHSPSLTRIFVCFFRLGAGAFGGPAMLEKIRRVVVDREGWFDRQTFRDGLALCQALPGPTAVQIAIYSGGVVGALSGAAASLIGFTLPAFALMIAFAALYEHVHSLTFVVAALAGMQAITVAVVAKTAISFGRSYLHRLSDAVIAGSAALLYRFGVAPVVIVLLAGYIGLVTHRGVGDSAAPAGSSRRSVTTDWTNHSMTEPRNRTGGGSVSSRSFAVLLLAVAGGLVLVHTFLTSGLFDLVSVMGRIDLLAFGGGYASLSLMFHEIVNVHGWVGPSTFLDGLALAQLTPGPILLVATFVGFLMFGYVGAVLATVAVFLPSFVMVAGLSRPFNRMRRTRWFSAAARGVSASFVGFLVAVIYNLGAVVHWDAIRIGLAGAAFMSLIAGVDVVWVVLAGVALSMLLL